MRAVQIDRVKRESLDGGVACAIPAPTAQYGRPYTDCSAIRPNGAWVASPGSVQGPRYYSGTAIVPSGL